MPARRARRPAPITRHLLVTRWRASLGSHYSSPALGLLSAYLSLDGQLDEPLRGIRDAHLQISPDLDWESRTSAGMLIGLKPDARFVILVPPIQFERLWQLAVGNACRSVHLVFAEPKWRKATITDWYASSSLPDEDE